MQTKPTTAIIDGDIIAYRAAYWADSEGIDELPYRIALDIQQWTPDNIDKVIVAMSCPREDNYRKDFWPLYKEHRNAVKRPDSMEYSIECIYDEASSARCVAKLEADDLLGMMISSGKAIGITVDKDLRSVPGWHWNPDKEDEPVYVSEEEADRFFYEQWMTGDTTDNIFGLWKVGPAKAKKVLDATDPEDWDSTIMDMYLNEDWDKRPDNRTPDMSKEEFAIAQARCVRILREGDYNKTTKEVRLWSPKT